MPLLWALRDLLGLTGTKFGCGIGACGACTVLSTASDRSCIPRSERGRATGDDDRRARRRRLHPVQQAWIEEDVPQCGYCQAGQIMQAAALLKDTPKPTDQQITDAMSGVGPRHFVRVERNHASNWST